MTQNRVLPARSQTKLAHKKNPKPGIKKSNQDQTTSHIYRHFGLSPPATPSPSIRLLAREVIALLLLPLSSALGGRRKVAVAIAEDERVDSESASLPSRKGGGTGSMLLRLDL